MRIWSSLLAVLVLTLIAWLGAGVAGLYTLFGVGVPYVAFIVFAIGFIYRILKWGRSPVPFCIPTTCGQQKSLLWIKQAKIENPSGAFGVVGRMVLEILFFRSLFRNLKTEKLDSKLGFGSAKWLWLGGLAFHWSMLIILLRHLRLFLDPVPAFVQGLDALDSFLQIGLPLLYITDIVIVLALVYLLLRRFLVPQIKYISLAADYFPLFLLLGIATSGIIMRYYFRVDIVAVKELTLGLVTFRPTIPTDVGSIFYIHVFLVSSLFAYFPWSKLMHAGGIFLSPTRNMANNSRMVRHVNPWNYPVDVHSYEDYEADFREKMKKAGLPVETE